MVAHQPIGHLAPHISRRVVRKVLLLVTRTPIPLFTLAYKQFPIPLTYEIKRDPLMYKRPPT